MKKFDVRKVVILSAMAAISSLLYSFLKFPLPIFPSFLEFNFSMIPILIVVFMFGPVEGIMVVVIRFLVKFIIGASTTMYVGEFADVTIAVITILIMYFTYKRLKGKCSPVKATLISLCAASVGWTVGAMFANWLVLIPAYVHIAKFPMAAIIDSCSMIPGINEGNFMILYLFAGVLPFNLCLSIMVGIVTFIVHMRTKDLFNQEK